MVGADALVQGSLRRGVGTRGAGFWTSAQGSAPGGRCALPGRAQPVPQGRLLYRRHDLRWAAGRLCRGCRGLHGMGGRLGSSALRIEIVRVSSAAAGVWLLRAAGVGWGAADGVTAGSCRTPGPGSCGTDPPRPGLPPGGRPRAQPGGAGLLQHGAALRGGVPRAARRDDAAAAGRHHCARARAAAVRRAVFPVQGPPGAAGACRSVWRQGRPPISALEAPFSAMARATSSISLVMCGIIKVSERPRPGAYSGFVELARRCSSSHKADAFGAVADEVEPFGDGADDQQRQQAAHSYGLNTRNT